MSLCPSFYCSRCRFDHAGECATTTVVVPAPSRVQIVDVDTLQPPSFSGLSAHLPVIPAAGSRWQVQNKDWKTGAWGQVEPAIYEVVGVSGTRVRIRPAGSTNGWMEYDLEPWNPYTKLHWRMVPAP